MDGFPGLWAAKISDTGVNQMLSGYLLPFFRFCGNLSLLPIFISLTNQNPVFSGLV